MPRKPVGVKKKSALGIPMGAFERLTRGYSILHDEPTLEESEKLWTANRDFLMGLIGKNIKQKFPDYFFRGIAMPWGSRPWGWWQFEAPEPRKLLSGNPDHILEWSPTFFGKPHLVKSLEAHNFLIFETQPEYLERLNFLLPGEKRKIKPELIRV